MCDLNRKCSKKYAQMTHVHKNFSWKCDCILYGCTGMDMDANLIAKLSGMIRVPNLQTHYVVKS
jgi:hypothetical protein